MAASLSGLSASVTRILYLTGFPKELKTKDIQTAFAEYESANGGFKIKWKDDTSLLIIFQDAAVAKRAYLHTIAFPPPILTSASTGMSATIKPYDGSDAQTVIHAVNARGQPNLLRSHNGRAVSISAFPTDVRPKSGSSSQAGNTHRHTNSMHPGGGGLQHITVPEHPMPGPRDKSSPTLPSLPSHPTLNALISSSLGDAVAGNGSLPADPAILTTSLQSPEGMSGPRVGDPGKRIIGAALGMRHPSLGPKRSESTGTLQRAIAGLTVAE